MYIRFLLLQFRLLYILEVLRVAVHLKVVVDCTCVQHKMFYLQFQSFKNPFWSIFWHSLSLFWLLFSCQGYPAGFCFAIKNLIQNHCLFLIYASACLLLFLCLEDIRLNVSISGILLDVTWFFWFSRWSLLIVNVSEICCYILFSLQLLSTNCFVSALDYSVKSSSVVHILLNLSACK